MRVFMEVRMIGFMKMFRVDGEPLLVPDAGVEVSWSDLESEDSGRDEAGVTHRMVLRPLLGVWSFSYDAVTEEEKRYLERVFGEKSEFRFTHPDRVYADREVTCRAYRSGYGISWYCARTGLWRGLKFDIVEC